MDIRQYLKQVKQWVSTGEPFFHTRYNDGESLAMFQQFGTGSCTRHNYTPEIGTALQNTLQEIVTSSRENILFGTNCDKFKGVDGGRLSEFLACHPHLNRVFPGDSWYSTQEEIDETPIGDKGLLALLDAIRGQYSNVFVGNELLEDAKYCLEALPVVIPQKDGWSQQETVLRDCLDKGVEDSVYIWCAGFPGKVLSWEIWKQRPYTSHIDLGSLFDCVFHVGVASWMLRSGDDPHQTHKKFVERVIEPYVKSFIPKE